MDKKIIEQYIKRKLLVGTLDQSEEEQIFSQINHSLNWDSNSESHWTKWAATYHLLLKGKIVELDSGKSAQFNENQLFADPDLQRLALNLIENAEFLLLGKLLEGLESQNKLLYPFIVLEIAELAWQRADLFRLSLYQFVHNRELYELQNEHYELYRQILSEDPFHELKSFSKKDVEFLTEILIDRKTFSLIQHFSFLPTVFKSSILNFLDRVPISLCFTLGDLLCQERKSELVKMGWILKSFQVEFNDLIEFWEFIQRESQIRLENCLSFDPKSIEYSSSFFLFFREEKPEKSEFWKEMVYMTPLSYWEQANSADYWFEILYERAGAEIILESILKRAKREKNWKWIVAAHRYFRKHLRLKYFSRHNKIEAKCIYSDLDPELSVLLIQDIMKHPQHLSFELGDPISCLEGDQLLQWTDQITELMIQKLRNMMKVNGREELNLLQILLKRLSLQGRISLTGPFFQTYFPDLHPILIKEIYKGRKRLEIRNRIHHE